MFWNYLQYFVFKLKIFLYNLNLKVIEEGLINQMIVLYFKKMYYL